MALGGTLRLGYLESPEPEQCSTLGQTLKLDSECGKGDKVKGEPGNPPLEWTYAPTREVRIEGATRYQVSTPERQGRERAHMPHLCRTTRIEPGMPGRPPPVPGRRKGEQITVTEKDLKRCGNDLRLLRECQVQQQPDKPVCSDLELSFKSAFDKRCRSEVALRDPWKDMENPEETRVQDEKDFILNQVWCKAITPRKIERDPDEVVAKKDGSSPTSPGTRRSCSLSTRASSADPFGATPPSGAWRGVSSEGLSRGRRRTQRASSRHQVWSSAEPRPSSALPSVEGPQIVPHRGRPGSRQGRRSGSFQGSRGSSRGGSAVRLGTGGDDSSGQPTGSTMQTGRFESRIKDVGDAGSEEENDGDLCRGSLEVRNAARQQRRFQTLLTEQSQCSSVPLAVWLSLDPDTGDVDIYPKAVAARIEGAQRHGRRSVPLAGLGGAFEDSIVSFGLGSEDTQPVQRTWDGTQRDVRRIEFPDASEITLRVTRADSWRIVDGDFLGEVEERRVALPRSEAVGPPSPSLPPVNHDRRVYFYNEGAEFCM